MTEPTTTTEEPTTPTEPTTATPPETGGQGKEAAFTKEQQAEIDRLVGKARVEGRKAAEEALEQKRKDEEAERQRQKDIEAGEFDKVRGDLESQINDWKTKAEAHETRLNTAIAAIKPGVDTRWTDAPDEVKALYEGADDDVLAKAAFLDRTAALTAKLTAEPAKRVGPTPRPNGPTTTDKVTSPVTQRQITG